eukprot:TRINITY_DN63229_c0_g1_i1.p1 TRINITY_DN63229_c0_g1~~TRINITY_DN63229_c0_g1_i1.p1  ORF type:complete len:357 (+),score=51.71 TRINITY_DN63229_c0_g1_i1:179-1249(+)
MYDYYEVLGVSRNANEATLKHAYHKQSLKLHPDKPTGSTKAFQHLEKAYRLLSDNHKRARYDLLGIDLEERDGDTVGAHVSFLGIQIARIAAYTASRTSLGGVFVLLLPRYWPLRWCHGLASVGLAGFEFVRKFRAMRNGAHDAEEDAPLLPSASISARLWRSVKDLGGQLTAAFAAGWVAHQTQIGKRFALPWFYDAGVIFTVFGCPEGVDELTSRTIFVGRSLGCLLAARWLGSKTWRWFSVIVVQLVALVAAPCVFEAVGTVATTAADSKMGKYAQAIRGIVDSSKARSEELQRRVTELELTLKATNAKLEKYVEYAQKAREVVDRKEEQRKRLQRRVTELEAASVGPSSVCR